MILEGLGAQEGSHDYKAINTVFSSMPTEDYIYTNLLELAVDPGEIEIRTVETPVDPTSSYDRRWGA